jgi:lysophospholipase L1-like esterase
MNLKYTLGSLMTIPLLPAMYLHGKKIKASIPDLPDAAGTEGVSTTDSDRHFRLLTIGESSIAGVGVETHDEGFTGTLARELTDRLKANISWKVFAKSGYTAQKLKVNILPQIATQEADLIVIGLGGNDAFTLNTPKKWKKHIHALLAELRLIFGNTPVVFINMPPIKEFPAFTPLIKWTVGNLVEILGEELNKLISNYQGVYYCNRTLSIADWVERLNVDVQNGVFFSDGIHPSKLTYQIWARDFSNFLFERADIRNDLERRLRM